MGYTPINLGQSNEALFKAVAEYKKKNNFKSFSEAGRKLVELGLRFEKAMNEPNNHNGGKTE